MGYLFLSNLMGCGSHYPKIDEFPGPLIIAEPLDTILEIKTKVLCVLTKVVKLESLCKAKTFWRQRRRTDCLKNYFGKWPKACLLHHNTVQWCSIENHQSPIHVVNFHFSRYPDGCLERCHNLVFFNHHHHIWELSNEVLYDPVPQGASKI